MMQEVIKGMRVVDGRDGRAATIGDKNSKCKTAIVFYDEPKENETSGKSISYSTIKKHFTEVVEEPEEVKEEKKPEEKKQKKQRKQTVSPDRENAVTFIDELIAKYNYIKTTYEKAGPRFIVLRTEEKGKVKYELYTGNKELKINMKVARADELGLEYKLANNYYLPAIVKIPYSEVSVVDAVLKI